MFVVVTACGMLLGSMRCHGTQAVGMISLTAAVHVFQGGLKRGGLKSPPPVLAQGGNQVVHLSIGFTTVQRQGVVVLVRV